MDKLDLYREKIKTILDEYAQYKYSYGEIDIEKIYDTQRDHYQIISIGWNDQTRKLVMDARCSLHSLHYLVNKTKKQHDRK